jgi:hypothetical protein
MRTHRGCHTEPKRLHPEDLQRLLRSGPPRPRPELQWRPAIDYELIAKHMHPNSRAAYITRCEEWFAAHPPRPPLPPAHHETVDHEVVAALIAKYGACVPIEEFRRAGYSEAALEKVSARRQWWADHSEELDAEIERRWPGSTKTKTKKVIKAVKKKMV